MRLETITIRESGTPVNGTAITSSFISDVFEIGGFAWTLNVWFDGAITGSPTFSVQVSNDTDTDSFISLGCANNTQAPTIIGDGIAEYKYFRIVYSDNGATGGDKYFDFKRVCQ